MGKIYYYLHGWLLIFVIVNVGTVNIPYMDAVGIIVNLDQFPQGSGWTYTRFETTTYRFSYFVLLFKEK